MASHVFLRSPHNKKGRASFLLKNESLFHEMKRLTYHILLGAVLLALLSVLFSSCNDEEQFTTASGCVLRFSQDTIRFDTVFTGVTSPTERFQVYNKNDKGLRIAQVKLESGGTSGFMMNVDGQNGSTVDDVQVLKNDSIFVFVKINAPASTSMEPTKITDAIIFTLESGVQQKVLLEASGQNIQLLRGEVLKSDRTFTPDELPCVIYDSLVVAENATMRVAAGTTLYFHNGADLIVHGKLEVEGMQGNPVTLRGDRIDWMFDYLPYDRLDNQWGGIVLSSKCKGCTLNHADIHSGNFGLLCDEIEGNVSITNTIIHNVGGYGLYLKKCNALVANTQISNTKDDCVSIYGGKSEFIHCTLAQFYLMDGERGHALSVSNILNKKKCLVEAANFYNCFITGYADNEVYTTSGDSCDYPLNLNFYNCVLLTDIEDETFFHDCIEESKDSTTYKETNFKTFDTYAYYYDFRLDTLSIARGKGSTTYSVLYPTDRYGTERATSPDAGCYQFK